MNRRTHKNLIIYRRYMKRFSALNVVLLLAEHQNKKRMSELATEEKSVLKSCSLYKDSEQWINLKELV